MALAWRMFNDQYVAKNAAASCAHAAICLGLIRREPESDRPSGVGELL